ncbi:MAG: hypothetical protein FD152_1321 [Xanthobacteraceae bacterium]|nr:MAG: hypothetical protein FD152_1321 [Xanthobacteraceae bacterium]
MIEIRHTRRRVAMMTMLATGWLPWGIEWKPPLAAKPRMPKSNGRYVMSCGYSIGRAEAQRMIAAGLVVIEKDEGGRDALVLGPNGQQWLKEYWP